LVRTSVPPVRINQTFKSGRHINIKLKIFGRLKLAIQGCPPIVQAKIHGPLSNLEEFVCVIWQC
jgi:hypothetical protein